MSSSPSMPPSSPFTPDSFDSPAKASPTAPATATATATAAPGTIISATGKVIPELAPWLRKRSAAEMWQLTFRRLLVGVRGGRFLTDLESRGRVLDDGRRVVQTKLARQGQWFGEVEVLLNMRTYE